ncbi:hypothetical protein AB205_0125480 [Aquarana catesbeiana]|uniref:Uncharacterized protein n=1 Tax=Aquarana catesbeiana TaxID=8400 RepID=A0A2G9QH80_AQUCT|nr:hypothetical protein AB205_0125480 [Aquarana catesbeiana]
MTFPSNVSYCYLLLPSNICVLTIPIFYSHRGEKTQDI